MVGRELERIKKYLLPERQEQRARRMERIPGITEEVQKRAQKKKGRAGGLSVEKWNSSQTPSNKTSKPVERSEIRLLKDSDGVLTKTRENFPLPAVNSHFRVRLSLRIRRH